jgi:hypothetical protein
MAISVKVIALNAIGWGGRRPADDVTPERAAVPPEDQALLDAYSRAVIDVVDRVGPAVVGLAARSGDASARSRGVLAPGLSSLPTGSFSPTATSRTPPAPARVSRSPPLTGRICARGSSATIQIPTLRCCASTKR